MVGLLSFDSGLGPELIERMPHELLHLEALAGWLARTLEMLDANSYDSLTGDYGIYSSRHYAWKLAGLHNRESLRLVYCGLNGSEGLGSSANSEERDEVIRDFGRRLSDYCKSSKAFDEFWIFRFKEDEFGILLHLFQCIGSGKEESSRGQNAESGHAVGSEPIPGGFHARTLLHRTRCP